MPKRWERMVTAASVNGRGPITWATSHSKVARRRAISRRRRSSPTKRTLDPWNSPLGSVRVKLNLLRKGGMSSVADLGGPGPKGLPGGNSTSGSWFVLNEKLVSDSSSWQRHSRAGLRAREVMRTRAEDHE